MDIAMGLIINDKHYPFEQWQALPESPAWIGLIRSALREWFEIGKITSTTSGSTGHPKTFTFNKEQIEKSAEQTAAFFHLTKGTKALLVLPADKIGGKMMIYRALLGGWELYCTPPSGLPEISEAVDFAALTPHQTLRLLNEMPEAMRKIKTLIIGGAPVTSALAQKIKNSGTTAFETYGMTETISHIALRRISPDAEHSFTALKFVDISIDDRDCLNVKTTYTDALQTNDIVTLINDRQFIWKGRADFVINSGGIKIHPEEIESILENYISGNYYVGCKSDAIFGQVAVLVVEGAEKDIELEANLRLAFQRLPATNRPKEIIYVDHIATTNGKTIREIWS
jgi:o-succinylbenzoate---CoA ligase